MPQLRVTVMLRRDAARHAFLRNYKKPDASHHVVCLDTHLRGNGAKIHIHKVVHIFLGQFFTDFAQNYFTPFLCSLLPLVQSLRIVSIRTERAFP